MKLDNIYIDTIKKRKEKIISIQEEIKELSEACIKNFCPVNVGDTVKVNGYSHQGKEIVIDTVFLKENNFHGYHFVAKGYVIKKDKTLSNHHRGEWYSNRE